MFHGLKSNEIFCAYVNLSQKRPSSKAASAMLFNMREPFPNRSLMFGSRLALEHRTHSKSPSSRPRGPFLLILQSYFCLWTFQKLFSSHFFSEKENINKKLHVHGNRSVVVVSHAWLIFRKRWYSKKPSNLSISGAWVLTMLVYKDLWMLLFFFGFSKSVLNLWRSNGNQDLVELFSSSTQR